MNLKNHKIASTIIFSKWLSATRKNKKDPHVSYSDLATLTNDQLVIYFVQRGMHISLIIRKFYHYDKRQRGRKWV